MYKSMYSMLKTHFLQPTYFFWYQNHYKCFPTTIEQCSIVTITELFLRRLFFIFGINLNLFQSTLKVIIKTLFTYLLYKLLFFTSFVWVYSPQFRAFKGSAEQCRVCREFIVSLLNYKDSNAELWFQFNFNS